jgi:ribosome-associated protein
MSDLTQPTSNESGGLDVAPGVRIARAELQWHFARSGGPGGQNVNKVNTKAELRIRPEALLGLSPRALWRLKEQNANRLTSGGELLLSADDSRSQERNRNSCLERLREMIVLAQIEPKPRRKTKPSRSSKERRLNEKRAHSDKKRSRSGPFE